MDAITNLTEINLVAWGISTLVILVSLKFIGTLCEYFISKLGLETKGMREKREDHDLLIKTSKNLAALQEKHNKDENEIKQCITSFIEEQRNENNSLRNEMRQYTENRVNDRQVSIDREKRLNGRIDNMVESDKCRDKAVSDINNSLKKLTDMVIDKNINDYRWEIINFATAISEGKPCNKDGFKHCLATYEKYEKILEENGLENGEVEISMEVVNEAYKEKLKNGF